MLEDRFSYYKDMHKIILALYTGVPHNWEVGIFHTTFPAEITHISRSKSSDIYWWPNLFDV